MVVCGECGERNPVDARFCRVCEAYLEWEGARVAAPDRTAVDRTAPDRGAPDRAAPERAVPDVAAPETVPPAAAPDAERQAPVSAPAPVPAPAPAPVPAPRQPTDSPARRHHRGEDLPADRPLSAGDLICGQCGAGNAPSRRFCRRCAAPLADARVVRTPWWRRLWRRWTQRRRRRWLRRSGERPAGGRSKLRVAFAAATRVIRWTVVALLALTVLAYALVPAFRGWVNPAASGAWHKSRSAFATKYVPVRPTLVTANGDLPNHAATLAIDTLTTTYWAAREGAPEPILVLTLERPAQIRRAIIHNGAAQDFQNLHRARELHLVFSTGHTADVTLTDSPDPQTLDIPGGADATSVEIHIMSVYHAVRGTDIAIAEIELFAER